MSFPETHHISKFQNQTVEIDNWDVIDTQFGEALVCSSVDGTRFWGNKSLLKLLKHAEPKLTKINIGCATSFKHKATNKEYT